MQHMNGALMDIHDIYRPILTYFRTKRMAEFCRLLPVDEKTRIVDVGGYQFNWTLIKQAPEVLMLNLEREEWQNGRFRKQYGDGRALDFEDDSFDIAFSNSVIEHVGEWADQAAFAREIRRVAPSYYVQTPNRYFFMEPHLLAPFVHFLPRRVLRRVVRYGTGWGWLTKPTQEQVDACLRSIRLLTKAEMKQLFPDADIIEEKFMGLTKSFIAVRASSASIGSTLRTPRPDLAFSREGRHLRDRMETPATRSLPARQP
jgi:2-polyprenyl-3-methyl-5-hydroxy-6-metoxy-1,4-benzoquinol methylase